MSPHAQALVAEQLPLHIQVSTSSRTYQRREPETTILHAIVREHLDAFLQHARDNYARPLPKYVERELRGYTKCGLLRYGFTRVRCPSCRHEFLVAFSCGSRTLCPSCSTRRMVSTAAHMATKVLPDVAVRQWVLSVPHAIRWLLASNAQVLSAVLRIFGLAVAKWYETEAKRAGLLEPKTGGLHFPQRFGGSLNVHVHDHSIFVDGVFTKQADGSVHFVPSRAPTQTEIVAVAAEVGRRVIKWLRRRGYFGGEGSEDLVIEEQTAIEACMQVGMSPGNFERITEQGQPDATIERDDARFDHRKRSPWSGEADGFSVHAGVQMRAGDADGRERLVRYCARPALSLERLSVLPSGLIAYRTKYPLRGGGWPPRRNHRIMTPLEFMARLAALLPPPRYPLVRYIGVLAPASKWRRLVVPKAGPPLCEHEPKALASQETSTSSSHPSPRTVTPTVNKDTSTSSSHPVPKPVSEEAAAALTRTTKPSPQATRDKFRGRTSTSYIDWATLMRRGLGLDVLDCPKCHDRMRPVAVLEQEEVCSKILTHLKLPLRPEELSDGVVVYDVTAEPVFDSDEWMQNAGSLPRGPPSNRDGIDPPTPAE
jgi:ribosomal protein S27E